ncbi:hypothetical protein L9F63_023028, partial [Diploptera punctata]
NKIISSFQNVALDGVSKNWICAEMILALLQRFLETAPTNPTSREDIFQMVLYIPAKVSNTYDCMTEHEIQTSLLSNCSIIVLTCHI